MAEGKWLMMALLRAGVKVRLWSLLVGWKVAKKFRVVTHCC